MAHDPDSAHREAANHGRARTRSERHRGSGGGGRVVAGFAAGVKEVVIVLAMALVLSFVVKTFLVQAFFIPSESMEDTLLVGDRVVVSKLTPGPFDIDRGDVVVFDDPGGWLNQPPPADRGPLLDGLHDGLVFVGLLPDTSEGHLIKRVIGLPGDKVECCDAEDRLLVNGEPIDETSYIRPGSKPSEVEFNVVVPEGHLWVMGDNRGESSDSRFHDPEGTGKEGSVPMDLVVGKAFVKIWPLDRISMIDSHDTVFSDVPPAGSQALAETETR
ncbi:signal peptidase I [Janibacter corallicola]|uniref:signal peptidase I n=1 Tax=Janibacter corallicola TaxID=415212 RepID=UPI000829ECD7|nr:signal peptidase I [Janibacter corallicola]